MYNGVSFFRRLGALTGANKARYAARHGYEYVSHSPAGTVGLFEAVACGAPAPDGRPVLSRPVSDTEVGCFVDRADFSIDGGRKPTFGKLRLARAACVGRHDAWLLWSDADAMVINQSVPLEGLIDDAMDFMVTADWLMLQAGVFLVKCSEWGLALLRAAEEDRTFDGANALDQSALQAVLNKEVALPPLAGEAAPSPIEAHVRWLPKRVLDVYAEEYVPGDFLVHFAGKLYEATEKGLWSIARQFELLSLLEDVADIAAFFDTRYLLNAFSGTCVKSLGQRSVCKPDDPRRVKLKEPLSAMARTPTKGRYRHVGLRYFWLEGWSDKYDVAGWDQRAAPLPVGSTAVAVRVGRDVHAPNPDALPGGDAQAGDGDDAGIAFEGGDAAGGGGGPGVLPDGDTQLQEPDDGLVEGGAAVGGGGDAAFHGGHNDDRGELQQLADGGDDPPGAGAGPNAKGGAGGPEDDDVDGDESDAPGGAEGGWLKWVVIGVLVAGIAVATRVLIKRRRRSPDKAL